MLLNKESQKRLIREGHHLRPKIDAALLLKELYKSKEATAHYERIFSNFDIQSLLESHKTPVVVIISLHNMILFSILLIHSPLFSGYIDVKRQTQVIDLLVYEIKKLSTEQGALCFLSVPVIFKSFKLRSALIALAKDNSEKIRKITLSEDRDKLEHFSQIHRNSATAFLAGDYISLFSGSGFCTIDETDKALILRRCFISESTNFVTLLETSLNSMERLEDLDNALITSDLSDMCPPDLYPIKTLYAVFKLFSFYMEGYELVSKYLAEDIVPKNSAFMDEPCAQITLENIGQKTENLLSNLEKFKLYWDQERNQESKKPKVSFDFIASSTPIYSTYSTSTIPTIVEAPTHVVSPTWTVR